MSVFAPVLANLLLLMSACGFGSLLRGLLSPRLSEIDRLAICIVAGFGMQGTLLFLVGLFKFNLISFLFVLCPGALLGLSFLRKLLLVRRKTIDTRRIPLLPAVIIGFVLVITILGGLSEPYGNLRTNDSIAYHYLGPKVWLREGVIRPVAEESLTSFPAVIDIQYAPLMAFGGPSGPAFFSVSVFVLMLLVVAGISVRCKLDSASVWWVLALISAMPAVYFGLYDGMIDVVYSCFLLLAARIAFDADSWSDFALVGMFCGFAMGSKYTALVMAPLLCICVLFYPSDTFQRCSGNLLKRLSLAAFVACCIASPWYLRNAFVLGCPIYPPPPLLARIFSPLYLPPEAVQNLKRLMMQIGRGMGHDPYHLLTLPLNLTFHPANFESGAGGIGLVPLAFLPFSFRFRRWDAFGKGLALFAFLMTLAWFYTAQESRFLIQVYLIVAIFGVAGWMVVLRNSRRFTRIVSTLIIAVSVLYGLFMIVAARMDDMHSVISPSFAESRRHAEIPFLESFRYLNGNSAVGKVLILDPFVPSYYLDKEYLKLWGRHGEESVPGVHTPQEVLSDLQERKVTHVLDVQWMDGNFKIPENPKNLVLVFEADGQRIYRVSPPGGH